MGIDVDEGDEKTIATKVAVGLAWKVAVGGRVAVDGLVGARREDVGMMATAAGGRVAILSTPAQISTKSNSKLPNPNRKGWVNLALVRASVAGAAVSADTKRSPGSAMCGHLRCDPLRHHCSWCKTPRERLRRGEKQAFDVEG